MTEDRKSVAVDSVADMLDTQEIKDDISVLSLATKRDNAAQEDADGAALSPQNPTIRTSDSTASRASLDSSGNRKKNNRKSKSGRKSWRKSRFGDPPEPELPELTRRQQLVDDLQDTYDPAEADGAVAVAERMFGPANFGTIQFDNLNIAWYGNFDIVWGPSLTCFFSSMPPHARRMPYSTWYTCVIERLIGACNPDGVPDLRVQVRAGPGQRAERNRRGAGGHDDFHDQNAAVPFAPAADLGHGRRSRL